MKIAITGATGFVGTELIKQLDAAGDSLKCWRRPVSNLEHLAPYEIDWIQGELGAEDSANELVAGCDVVVHAGLWRSGMSIQANESDVVKYARINILGTLQLIEAAIAANVKRFIFVSTCAVHDHILNDRPLDEAHPLWANSHYGAHKAAIEKFVHSYGFGVGFPICAVRPTGIYGVARPLENSKWFNLIRDVRDGKTVEVTRGGKEVHVADVAKSIRLLLSADGVRGQAYSCYDRYISQFDVAMIAKQICGSKGEIVGEQKRPKHEIDSSKIQKLGMTFGGQALLEQTVKQILARV